MVWSPVHHRDASTGSCNGIYLFLILHLKMIFIPHLILESDSLTIRPLKYPSTHYVQRDHHMEAIIMVFLYLIPSPGLPCIAPQMVRRVVHYSYISNHVTDHRRPSCFNPLQCSVLPHPPSAAPPRVGEAHILRPYCRARANHIAHIRIKSPFAIVGRGGRGALSLVVLLDTQ